ncbi:MAG: hypothetical protein MJ196_06060 [Treponemataceae bacterium]|nr:hypothetical protein [Treponemataceae bacterium]
MTGKTNAGALKLEFNSAIQKGSVNDSTHTETYTVSPNKLYTIIGLASGGARIISVGNMKVIHNINVKSTSHGYIQKLLIEPTASQISLSIQSRAGDYYETLIM